MSCTANRRILHCTYYVKKTDLLHKNAQRSLKVSQSELSCHQGEKQVIIKFIFKRYTIYISHSLVSLTISVGYQMTLSINHHWKKKKALMLFLLEVPNATDVSWNEEFEFPVTPVSRLSRGEVKLGNPETLKSFAVFGNI